MIYIIEGVDGAGKTTFIDDKKAKFCGEKLPKSFKRIKLPAHYPHYKMAYEKFLNEELTLSEYMGFIYGEHITILTDLILANPEENYVLDRSFISFLVYQEQEIKDLYFKTGIDYRYNLFQAFKFLCEKKDVKVLLFQHIFEDKQENHLEKRDKTKIKQKFLEICEELKARNNMILVKGEN